MTATTTHRNEAMTKQSENITGWVGITKSHGLAGWVYNHRKADERLKVKIIVNGVEIATIQADEEREHLQKRGENGGAKVGHGSGGMILLRAA